MTVTQRLYHQDSYCREFDADVVAMRDVQNKPAVVLTSTCFYPTSGGQPNDLGDLNGIAVEDVLEQDGEVVHVLAAPLAAGRAHGRLDWPRRFDHMQQHTGQHILSQAFQRLLGAPTVSFHLGSAITTIDIDLPALEPEDAARVEELANQVITANFSVTIQVDAEGEANAVRKRQTAEIHGPLRIVRIADFDACACGGTHVRATGEVGSLHIRRWSKSHGQIRIEFLCGGRALRDHRTLDRLCQAAASALSIGVDELPQGVARLIEADQARNRQIELLRTRLIESELPQLAQQAERIGQARVVARVLDGYDVSNMRAAAQQLIQQPATIALLAVAEPSPQVCFARSTDLTHDMGQLLREALAAYGGRGGGKPHFAQGGGVTVENLANVLQTARAKLATS